MCIVLNIFYFFFSKSSCECNQFVTSCFWYEYIWRQILLLLLIELIWISVFASFFMAADGPLPSVLQEVSVPVINNTLCEGMYRNAGYIEHIPHIFICAGWKRGGYDSCEGEYQFLLFGLFLQNQSFHSWVFD